VTLRACDAELYAHLDRIAHEAVYLIDDALTTAGVDHQMQFVGNLFSCFFSSGEVRTFADAQKQDTAAFSRFFHSLLSQGVSVPPSAYEAWFVSAAHDAEAMDRFASALPAAARAARGA